MRGASGTGDDGSEWRNRGCLTKCLWNIHMVYGIFESTLAATLASAFHLPLKSNTVRYPVIGQLTAICGGGPFHGSAISCK
jgi:hypothetical protein